MNPSADRGPASDADLRHHGDVEARGARLDFAVNVVTRTPPAFMLAALRGELENVAAYPDELPTRRALAAHLGLDPSSILLVNGVAEAFTLIASLTRWRRPTVVHPQFTEPEAALRAAGRCPERVVLRENDGFDLTPEAVDRIGGPGRPGSADLVIVGNPTNPTSRLHDPRILRSLTDTGQEPGTGRRLLVVDEAFMDVVAPVAPSLLPEAPRTTGLLVLRSLTKTFALAGVRAGYVVGRPELLTRMRELQPPWSVNSMALAATRAAATAEADHYVEHVARLMEQRRPYLVQGLTERGWDVVPGSRAPFVLARHPRADRLRRALREQGIAVRRGHTFPGLDRTWARFALRDLDATRRLFDAFDALDSFDGTRPVR